jgi:succinate-semialdehyde dehydrogenase / glutarate-semialdehyde dehydrogenase
MQVRNPRSGQFDYEIYPPKFEEMQSICQNLRENQGIWSESTVDYRIDVLQKWKKTVEKYKEDLIEAISIDTGRLHESKLEAEIVGISIDRWCKIGKEFFVEPQWKNTAIPFLSIEQDLVPYSLIGVISPWNFPLLLSLIDTIPALVAGCSVIVKPSEVTPRFIKIIEKTIEEVPQLRGVLKYIEGAGDTGSQLLDLCDLICFTGSTSTGRKVYDKASQNFIHVFLELGGKDAALVFEDADIEQSTSALLWGSVVNAGQSCLSIERIYVQESIFEKFVERIKVKTEDLRFAYPTMDFGQIGPIISEKQVEIINSQLKDAIEKGANIITGMSECINLKGGMYCYPTILTNVNENMKVMTEETFGPIMPISTFKDEDDAIRKANSTIYGLSGAVFTSSPDKSIRIAKRMNCGAVSINDAALTAIMHEGEKNSFKMSGIGGTRMGPSAIKRFMRQKAYLIKNQSVLSPWWF